MSIDYDALVVDNTVYVIASGVNPTSGWKSYFNKSHLAIYPPEFSFIQEAPCGIALQVITSFSAETHFGYKIPKPTSIKVTDATGVHHVTIRGNISVAERALIERGLTSRVFLPGSKRLGNLSNILVKKDPVIYYERPLGSYDDLLNQHCTTECVSTSELDHTGIIVCDGYRTVCQHSRVHAVLTVQVGTKQDIANAVERALEKAAIAAAIVAFLAAFATGGSAAAASAKATFVSVLTSEIAQSLTDIIRVDVDYREEWV